jgi:biotin transporter BioY
MLWLILGFVIGAGALWLASWARAKNVKVSWLAWLLLAIAVVSALSGIQNYVELMAEYEPQAAVMMIPMYGVQVLVPAALAVLLVWRGQKRVKA